MPSYTLTVLGLEVSFKAQADQERVLEAKKLLEERYEELSEHGRRLSKEKLLTFLALGLADDLLQCNSDLDSLEGRLSGLLAAIEKAETVSTGI